MRLRNSTLFNAAVIRKILVRSPPSGFATIHAPAAPFSDSNDSEVEDGDAASFCVFQDKDLLRKSQSDGGTGLYALDLIQRGSLVPDYNLYSKLLKECTRLGKVEQGRIVHAHLVDSHFLDNHLVLQNIIVNMYAKCGCLDDARRMFDEMPTKDMSEVSWNALISGHARKGEGEHALHLLWKMQRKNFQPTHFTYSSVLSAYTSHVLLFVDQQEREEKLQYHSEKLALAFALLNTPTGSPIRIKKNIRVCGDCHAAIKFVSKVVDREIIVRDTNRFHRFRDGSCSCGDYW
ncbi:unnamed protein product, partial [Vitis vinifera]